MTQTNRGAPLPSCTRPQDGVTEKKLIAVLMDEAGREEVVQVEAHLGACPCCKEWFDAHRRK